MEYRKFDKLNIKPSLLGFGTMRLPIKKNNTIDVFKTKALFKKAIKSGITYFDTAFPYHNETSEIVVGKILSKYKRESFILTSKLPVWKIKKEEQILEYFNTQLKKLRTPYLDIYLLHAINKESYLAIKSLNVFNYLTKLKNEGKIRYIGFSFHGSSSDFEYILNDGLKYWDVVQIQLNYMDIDHQQGVDGYRLLEKHNIPVIIMEPVKGGSLSKLPENISSILNTHNWSNSSWAFRYLFQYKNILTILSGMTTMDQLKDNLNTFNDNYLWNYSDEETISKVRELLKQRIYVPCTGCGYCMPCPKGVNIKAIFSRYNEMYMYERCTPYDIECLNEYKIDNCVKCGLCLKKCPQSIDIYNIIDQIKNKTIKN